MPTKTVTALALLLLAAPAAASWLENDANPVFSPPGGASWPSVLHDAASFPGAGPAAPWKMWFVRGEGAGAVLAHSVSQDGRHWTEVSGDLGLGAGLTAPRVSHDPNRFGEGPSGPLYKMWLSDRNPLIASIRLFVSEDGLAWTDRGIVIDGLGEFENMWNMAVAYRPAAGGSSAVDSVYLGFASKGPTVTLFTSPDGETWTQAQPLTLEGTDAAPLVLPDGTVRLFATATRFSNAGADGLRIDQYQLIPLGDGSGYDLRLMDESMSGVGALGAPGTWNDSAHLAPAVAFDGTAVHVFTAGSGPAGVSAVGLATSQRWFFGDTWEPGQGARDPEVLTDDASFTGYGTTVRYKMWHSNAARSAISHVGSVDGDKWNLLSAAVTGLRPGARNAEVVHDASGFGVAPMSHAYRMVYRDPNAAPGIGAFRTASSMDGVSWSDDQPLEQVGTSVIDSGGGAPPWNAVPGAPVKLMYHPQAPASLDLADPMNNRWVLFYSASDGLNTRWGLAVSTDGLSWQGWQDGAAPVLWPGLAGEWDSGQLGAGSVVLRPDGSLAAWFGAGTTADDEGVGFASSSDGVLWTRCANNPILAFGGCGPFGGLSCGGLAETGNGAPTALLEEAVGGGCTTQSQYRLWRGGQDSFGDTVVASSSSHVGLPSSGSVLQVPSEYPSIQSAINAAVPGSSIIVSPGVYDENLVIDRPLQLIGADRETTVVRSATSLTQPSAVVWVRGTSGSVTDCVSISGFTFDGMTGDPARQVDTCVRTGDTNLQAMTNEAGWAPRNTEVTIRDCRLENARHRGVLVHAAYRPSIENCVITGFGDGFLPQAEPYVGVDVMASKLPVVTGNSITLDADPTGLSVVNGILLDPVGTLLWEGLDVSDNTIVGPNVGGGLVVHGDGDTEPARHVSPDQRRIAGNLVDGMGSGTQGLLLRGGIYGARVRDNELRANDVNVWMSDTGTALLPVLFEDNLVQGVHVLPGDHGLYLDDEDRDGLDQVHLVLTGNTIRNHSGSGIFAVNKSSFSTVTLGDAGDPSQGNDFFDNCRYNIELSRDTNNPLDLPNNLQIEALNNWWGVECGPGVQSTIFDRFAVQWIGLGTVTVVPWTDSQGATIDDPVACQGEFSPKTLVVDAGNSGAGQDIEVSFSFDVIAGEVELESWIVQFPDEMVFNGFPQGPAGTWSFSGLSNGSFELIGIAPDTAYFDRNSDGNLDADDYLVHWSAPEFQVALGTGAGGGVEPWSLLHVIDLAPGLFTNPAEPGNYVIESRWRSRDKRLECTSFVETLNCAVPDTALVGMMQVMKTPTGLRAFWPALDPSGLSCFSGYAVLASDDPSDLGSYVDRSGLDLDGVPTTFTGDLPETYFRAVAIGPQGQYGPLAPDLPLP